MFFHKVTQAEITKAKNDGNLMLFEELTSKYVKQHKTPKYKKFLNCFLKYLPILDFIIAVLGIIVAIIALFN